MDKFDREQQRIVEALAQLYEEIRILETSLGLLVGKGDYRPRIEYFHDAVRALTQQNSAARAEGGRLSVELLAYDVSALRYIHAMPLSPLNPGHQHLSPHTQLAPVHPEAKAMAKKATRVQKVQLGELYGQYAVLFVALLKPVADQDFRDRVEEMNEQVQQLASVLHALEQLGVGAGSEQAVRTSMHHLEDAQAEHIVSSVLSKQTYKRASQLAGALKGLKDKINQADRAIAGIEAGHLQYVTAQLGIYEQGKEVIKRMAGLGINLAGRFTENAMAQEQRERGR